MDDSIRAQLQAVEGHLEVLSTMFLVVVLLEMFVDWRSRAPRDFRETGANLVVAIGQESLTRVVGISIALFCLTPFYPLSPFQVPITWWSWPVGFVVADFFYYWTHRLEHRSRLFWAHHSVHHSSEDFDFSTAGRIAWAEAVVAWYSLIPLVLCGFHPLHAVVLSSILLLAQTWIHTRKIGTLGVLEGVINTPSAHRVHHGSNPEYLDSNYGAVLMVWDRLFGTYVAESAPVRFGLTVPIATKNPLRINVHEYLFLAKKLLSARTWRERLLWLVGPPEWSPEREFAATKPTSWWRSLRKSLVERAADGR